MSNELGLALCDLRYAKDSIVTADNRLWLACNRLAEEDKVKLMAIKAVRVFTISLEECLCNLINEMEAEK